MHKLRRQEFCLAKGAIAVIAVTGLMASCSRNSQPTTAEQVLRELKKVEYIPAKMGEPQADKSAKTLLEKGTMVAPLLVSHITNDGPSRVFELFEYKIGDVAHRLLCELYKEPFLWPLEGRQPLDPATVSRLWIINGLSLVARDAKNCASYGKGALGRSGDVVWYRTAGDR